ncbi:hypothetical protein IMSAGC015_02400 [Lachnospiraceae bacterium]|nr:hypothetical protein IMSAGC015_02400 [Lachnospiraceae bacterium]
MSDNNTTINVQPILNLQSLHKQLSSQKFKINVDFDTSALNNQLQASIHQLTANLQPATIPIEADTSSLMNAVSMLGSISSTLSILPMTQKGISQSLD